MPINADEKKALHSRLTSMTRRMDAEIKPFPGHG